MIRFRMIGGSVTVNCGVASKIPGSIVNEMISKEAGKQLELRIGHAAGTIACESEVEVRGKRDPGEEKHHIENS
jgi:2-methylaconitate cis-trans-isomerase PrpF